MPKRTADLAQEWLTHHRAGFEVAAAQCKARHPQEGNWFESHAKAMLSTADVLKRKRVSFRTGTPLYVGQVRPRSRVGGGATSLRAYLALEAILSPGCVEQTSLKLGLIDEDAHVLLFRLLYDYDKMHTSEDGFPFHVHWGKPPGELGDQPLSTCFEPWLDEPRLPGVPLDFFLLLQILHDQFAQPPLTETLQSNEWTGVLRKSTHFVSRRWCQAVVSALTRDNLGLLPVARTICWPEVAAIAG